MRRFAFFLSFILFQSVSASAFLTDNDPTNFVDMALNAPWVGLATVQKVEAPTAQTRHFVLQLKVKKLLWGKELSDPVKVLYEFVFPNEASRPWPTGEFLVFIAALPNYTAYQPAVQQGVAYRGLAGRRGILPADQTDFEAWSGFISGLIESRSLSGAEGLKKRKAVYLQGLEAKSLEIRKEFAASFAAWDFAKNFLSKEDAQVLERVILQGGLDPKNQNALVAVLKRSADPDSLAVLRRLADGPGSPAKWAAIRALESLGEKRSTEQRIADFQNSDEAEKAKALAFLIQQSDEVSLQFLQNFLTAPGSLALKKEAIQSMGRKGGAVYEKILLTTMQDRDEAVAAEAILALGRMQSREALPRWVQLLDSPSPLLRSAAKLALQASTDPRAGLVLQEKFPEGGVGHTH